MKENRVERGFLGSPFSWKQLPACAGRDWGDRLTSQHQQTVMGLPGPPPAGRREHLWCVTHRGVFCRQNNSEAASNERRSGWTAGGACSNRSSLWWPVTTYIDAFFFFKGNNFFIPPKLAVYRTCSVKVNCRLRVCYLPPEDPFYPCT